jgi:hypothetical protein
MNAVVELHRRTWTAALELALVISTLAAVAAVAISAAGDVPQVAIVLPVIVVGFVASWVRTGRVRRESTPMRVPASRHRVTAPTH